MAFTNPHLSFSRINRFEQCPLSFKLAYVDRLPVSQPLPEPLRFGKVVHAALEHFFREAIEQKHEGPLDVTRLQVLFADAWKREGLQGLNLFTEGALMLSDYARRQHHVVANVLAVEQEFRLQAGPFTVLGYIDRVDRLDDETIEVIDYKTNRQLFSREEVDGSLQLALYEIAARRIWPWAKRVKLTFEMLRHGLQQHTSRTPEQLEATLQYVVATGRATEEAETFPARLGAHCATCDQRSNCPAYAEALQGKRAAVGADMRDLEAVAREREDVARLSKIFFARKNELDEVLRHHLRDRDELVLAGMRYTLTPTTTGVRYPTGRTLKVLQERAALPMVELIERLLVIDRDALDALVRSLAKDLDRPIHLLLRAELEALAERTVSPRFTAKEIRR
jgi:putative RecB family exonuclease